MDYVKNRKYFRFKTSCGKFPVFLIILGAFFFIMGIVTGSNPKSGGIVAGLVAGLIIGVPFIALGFIIIKIKTLVPDSYIDEQVDAEYATLKERALSKFGITAEKIQKIEPLILGGYMLEAAYLEDDVQHNIKSRGLATLTNGSGLVDKAFSLWDMGKDLKNTKSGMKKKKGKDKVFRTSAVGWSILLFSDDEVFLYQELINLLLPEDKDMLFVKYAYKDILSVSTEMETAYCRFILKISNGDTKAIPWYAGKNNKSYSPNDDVVEKTVSALKECIREKKRS